MIKNLRNDLRKVTLHSRVNLSKVNVQGFKGDKVVKSKKKMVEKSMLKLILELCMF